MTVPVARGASVRLTPFRDSPHVLLELRGPSGGDLGALVLHADNARLLASGLVRVADGEGTPEPAEAPRALALLNASLDPNATVAAFARLAVPVFADWCNIDVTDGESVPRRLTVVHADASKRREAAALSRYPYDTNLAHPRSAVWRDRTADLAPDVPPERLMALAQNDEHLEVLRAINPHSSISVPLVSEGSLRGVMTFAVAESRRRYGDRDLPLALTLARCTGLAADTARLYGEAHAALRPGIAGRGGSAVTR
jgi:GAF domain-containing protein